MRSRMAGSSSEFPAIYFYVGYSNLLFVKNKFSSPGLVQLIGSLSLQEQYSFPIFSDEYIFKNMGEAFRLPNAKHAGALLRVTSTKISGFPAGYFCTRDPIGSRTRITTVRG